MAFLPLLLLLLFTAGSSATDPCHDYTILSDVHRSTAYVIDSTEPGVCDMDKLAGWYRFNSSAGTTMPERCVEKNHCGAIVPIWMNGAHPTVADDIVTRQACANMGTPGNCCERYLDIRVKNCGHYFVYFLFPAPSCPIAYCAGDLQPCPLGKWSPNGLEPGCKDAFPKLTTNPRLQGPVVTATSFSFHCVIDFPDQDPTQQFEVAWTFDGVEDTQIPRELLMDPKRTAVLEGYWLKDHIGHDVGCKVRSSFQNGPGISSEWKTSNQYRAEIRVEPAHITVSEDGTDQTIHLTSTIPVVCDANVAQACVVSIALDTSGARNNIVVTNPCIYQLKSSDWDDQSNTVSTSITVAATKDKLRDGDKRLILSFRELFEVGGRYKEIYTGYQIAPVQVVAGDSPAKTCTMVTDPHITDFRGLNFHLYGVGVYTMYHHPDDNFEVQIHTYPCGSTVSCICGLAIREKQDVIRMEGCSNLGASLTIDIPNPPLREGTVVQRSTDGRTIVFYFPSGREVKVETPGRYNNVYITVPGSDSKGNGGGVCGTLDARVPNDHYVHRDGTWERNCGNWCIPRAFEETWRVDYANSLFKLSPNNRHTEDNHYCQCDDHNGDKRINCSVAADIYHNVQHCGGTCNPVNAGRGWQAGNAGVWQGGRRSVGFFDYDEPDPPLDLHAFVKRDFTIAWPTSSGITENAARQQCEVSMKKSQLWPHCHDKAQIHDPILNSCTSDVFFTDGFSMVDAALASFTSQCQSELSLDPSNYVTTDGDSVMKQELTDDVCSPFCLHHGHCVTGNCVCDPGFAGDNCQLDATKGPQLLRIRGSNYCDTEEKPCTTIFFDADNFQSGDAFLCKSQEVFEDGTISTASHFEEAIFINSKRLACTIPDAQTKTDRWLKTFSVSATFDGKLYGNALNITVYDSTCMSCDNTTGCNRKPNTCLINDLCYRDGDYKPGDATQRCVTSHSEDAWTTVSMCSGDAIGEEWTVFQRRLDGSQDFYLGWDQYVTGFGRNNSNYWMGLEPLHQLTSSGSYELRVDLKDWDDVMASASYSNFSISGVHDNYELHYGQFIGGDAGDSLSKHQDMPFSTKDADHDLAFTGSCADWYHGGWWYNACQDANLNGRYVTNNTNDARDGIQWNSFRGQGHSLQCTEMRVRPTAGNALG